MTKEIIQYQPLLLSLLDAAKREDWDLVDKELIPKLCTVDGDKMAKALLAYAEDESPNVRDLVATSLAQLNISDQEVVTQAIKAMVKMAGQDEEVFPAGRAAVFLINQTGRSDEIGTLIKQTLATFAKRVEEKGWKATLEQNIPSLDLSKLS